MKGEELEQEVGVEREEVAEREESVKEKATQGEVDGAAAVDKAVPMVGGGMKSPPIVEDKAPAPLLAEGASAPVVDKVDVEKQVEVEKVEVEKIDVSPQAPVEDASPHQVPLPATSMVQDLNLYTTAADLKKDENSEIYVFTF